MLSTFDQLTTVVSTSPLFFAQSKPVLPNLYFHLVLRVNNEISDDDQQLQIKKYIAGFVHSVGGSVKAVCFAQERIHLLAGLPQTVALATFTRELKLLTKTFANHKLRVKNFEWSEEYEAFTVSQSQLERVCAYIRRQIRFERQESYASSWHRVSSRELY